MSLKLSSKGIFMKTRCRQAALKASSAIGRQAPRTWPSAYLLGRTPPASLSGCEMSVAKCLAFFAAAAKIVFRLELEGIFEAWVEDWGRGFVSARRRGFRVAMASRRKVLPPC